MSIDTTQEGLQKEQATRPGMNTAKLKVFAQKARNILVAGVERKVIYWGFDKKGTVAEEPQAIAGGYMFRGEVYDDATVPVKWKALKAAISRKGVKEVVEEAAYTWFNRLLAVRILAQNKYDLPQLEYAEGADLLPLLLQHARRGQYDFLNKEEQQRLQQVIMDYEKDTEAFGILLIGYCHSHTLLNNIFGGIEDYTELLLPDDILSRRGFLHLLNTTDAITKEDYKQVELIGWLYQFYISEKKDEVFAGFKKNKKAEAIDIPAATQIFTPNWIVKYMVQNTIGKLWLDINPSSPLKKDMFYLVETRDQQYGDPIIKEVAEMKLLDPAAGSGHILVEGFDLLYQMYLEDYYQPEVAVESILKNNLFGLDIDKRAAQLSRFAILLKAASKHRNILKSGLLPHVYAMPEPAQFSRQEVLDFLGIEGSAFEETLTKTLTLMQDAQNLGSIMQFSLTPTQRDFIVKRFYELENKSFKSFSEEAVLPKIRPFIHVVQLLTMKYEAVVANPPYMGQKSMNGKLKTYIRKWYPNSKSDLMTVFIERALGFTVKNGLSGMVTLDSWMFLTSYQKLRGILLSEYLLKTMVHIGWNCFPQGHLYNRGTAFIYSNSKNEFSKAAFVNLSNVPATVDKHVLFCEKVDKGNYILRSSDDLSKIPGKSLVYWISDKTIDGFENYPPLKELASVKQGLATSDNNRFRRDWQEVSLLKTSIKSVSPKWYPYNSGGDYRKWYGNHYYLLNWENDGKEIKNFEKSVIRNEQFYLKESISWTKVTSGGLAFRFFPEGFVFDVAGCSVFFEDTNQLKYLCGLLNSNLKEAFVDSISPTINYEVGQISSFPVKPASVTFQAEIIPLVERCIEISRNDWNTREYSWEFSKHPLLNFSGSLSESYSKLVNEWKRLFFEMHKIEEEINQKVIDFYELHEELSNQISLSKITILQDELDSSMADSLESEFRIKGGDILELPLKQGVIMEQLISYAIGCFMGRYRLDKPGIQIAYPGPTIEESAPYTITSPLNVGIKKVTFSIDEDAIVPLMGKACRFTDDILHRTLQFVEFVWGEETLPQNLNFLQECLDQDLEQYLVRDFWKDHIRTYKKKPIYWLFTSPTGAFQVLAYMHRMNRFTASKVRDKYLLPHIQYLTQQIIALESQGAGLGRSEARQLDKLRKDLLECEQYDLLLKDKADQQIEFDLDDGVKANYELFKGVVAPIN